MKTHYRLTYYQSNLCGQASDSYVSGFENISQVTCERCKKIILANCPEMVTEKEGKLIRAIEKSEEV